MIKGLVGDLGGTNARFAQAQIAESGEVTISDLIRLKARDYPTAYDGLKAYIHQAKPTDVAFLAVACAGPVRDGKVDLTNVGWSLSAAELSTALKIGHVHLLNDLEAVAWAAPKLTGDDLRQIGGVAAKAGAGDSISVLGVGTGSNCATFMDKARGVVVVGEGGHISFAPNDEVEVEIWRRLASRFGHVSIERLASGPGLYNIYLAMCDMAGHTVTCEDSEDVSRLADAGDAFAEEVIDRFCRVIGAVGGDFALSFGASALYLAGGIAPQLMITERRAAAFRAGFENKGRFRPFVEAVGASVIIHPNAALTGAAHSAALTLKAA